MAEKRVDIVLRARDRASRVLSRLTGTLGRVQRSVLNIRTATLAVGFALAVRQGAAFEQEMARVQAITNATAADFARLQDEAKELGRTTQFSATQSAEAFSAFALAGLDVDTQLKAIRPTLNLAAAAQIQIGQAADITTKIMAGMAIEAEHLQQTVDVLTKSFTTANTDLVQLGDAMKVVGPIAKTVEKGIGEVVASIQLLSNAGIQGEQAGTVLRNVLIRLADPANQAKLKAIGVEALDASGKLRSMADIIDDFNARLGNLGSGQQLGVLSEIFGARTAGGFAELVSQGGDRLREFEAALESAGGTAGRIASVQMDTLTGSWQLFKSAVEGVSVAVTEATNSSLREILSMATAGASALSGLIEALGSMSSETAAAVATSIQLGVAFAVMLPLAVKLGPALAAATTALALSTKAMVAFAISIKTTTLAGNAFILKLALMKIATLATTAGVTALKVASVALQATLIGALATGLATVAIGFIRSRTEGISFGDAILRIADDLGLIDSKTIGVQRAQEALADASKKAKDAEAELNSAQGSAEKLAANEALITALQAQIKARKELEAAENKLFGKDISAAGLKGDPFTARLERTLAEARDRSKELRHEIENVVPPTVELAQTVEIVNDTVADMIKSLQVQADTIHLSKIEAELYKLSIEGATAAQLEQARALLETIDARKKEKDLIAEGVRLAQQHVAAEERVAQQVRAIEAARQAGRVSQEAADRATQEVMKQLEKTVQKVDSFRNATLGAEQSRVLTGVSASSSQVQLQREGIRVQLTQSETLRHIRDELREIRRQREFDDTAIVFGAGL